MKKSVRRVWIIPLAGAGLYLLLCLLLWLLQDRLLYFPDPVVAQQPSGMGMAYEDVRLIPDSSRPEEAVHGWYVPGRIGAGCVLFCHGNARNVAAHLDIVRTIHQLGYASFVFDYRGYGRSAGRPSEENMYQDAQAAWNELIRRGYSAGQIIIQGRSLGGGVASWLAARNAPAGLVLESTFTCLPDAAQSRFSCFPVRWLCHYQYDTINRLSQIHCPALFVFSDDDQLIPPAQGKTLFARYQGSSDKRLVELTGTHNDCYLTASKVYDAALRDFYATALLAADAAAASRRRTENAE